MSALILAHSLAPLPGGALPVPLEALCREAVGGEGYAAELLRERVARSPHVAELGSIALYDEARSETVLYRTAPLEPPPGVRLRVLPERELLAAFFEGLPAYSVVTTFRGSVDFWPLILQRSLQLKVAPPLPLPVGSLSRQTWHRELCRELGYPLRSRRTLLCELGCTYLPDQAAAPDPALRDVAILKELSQQLRLAGGDGAAIDF